MYLTQILHRNQQRNPARTALVCGSERRSYGELHARCCTLANELGRADVRPGDRVALLSHSSIECVELMFACWRLGAIFTPLNTRWSGPELADALEDCEPKILLADDAHGALAASLAEDRRVRLLRLLPVGRGAPRSGEPESPATGLVCDDPRLGADTLAALVYTGGTTGRSKGVMLTHANLAWAALCRLADGGSLEGSVALVSTPIFHVAALARLVPHLMAGGTCVILPQFDAAGALALIERERVTDLPFVPTMLQTLLDHPAFRPEAMRSVRRLSYGAAPSAGALLQRAMDTLPWVGLYQHYGMTESSAAATMSFPGDHSADAWQSGRAMSAGRACSVVELRVVNERDEDVAVGEVGEILLRGPVVSPGYWRRPEETARTFRGGWLHTGDAGRLDGDGYLYVVDRVKDMIVSGGENVYSAEVENALAQHAAVASVAVIGIPDPRWGEAVHAVVVLRPGATAGEAALKAHCRQRIAAYKVPKSFEFASALPLTAAGKIAKNLLREKHWQGYARRVN